jgi:hypothetical protein
VRVKNATEGESEVLDKTSGKASGMCLMCEDRYLGIYLK